MTYVSLNFTGPLATHTLLDAEGRSYRRHYLTEAFHRNGSGRKSLPTDREMGGHAGHDRPKLKSGRPIGSVITGKCACGRGMTIGRENCWRCNEAGRRLKRQQVKES